MHVSCEVESIQQFWDQVHQVNRDMVAALLDGATPLHCAAIRGSPTQIEHLVSHGADLYIPTAAGALTIMLTTPY